MKDGKKREISSQVLWGYVFNTTGELKARLWENWKEKLNFLCSLRNPLTFHYPDLSGFTLYVQDCSCLILPTYGTFTHFMGWQRSITASLLSWGPRTADVAIRAPSQLCLVCEFLEEESREATVLWWTSHTYEYIQNPSCAEACIYTATMWPGTQSQVPPSPACQVSLFYSLPPPVLTSLLGGRNLWSLLLLLIHITEWLTWCSLLLGVIHAQPSRKIMWCYKWK